MIERELRDQVLGQEGKTHVTPHFFSAAIAVNPSFDQGAPGLQPRRSVLTVSLCSVASQPARGPSETTHSALRASIALLQ